MPGPGGKLVTRHYYYQCDLGPHGRGKMKQTRLSFRKIAPLRPEDNPRGDEDRDRDDSGQDDIFPDPTSTEGQQ